MNYSDFIFELKAHVDIVAIVNEHVALSARNKALCPFHDEKTPSFSVHPQKQFFYCFGCEVGGDAIRFLELIHQKPHREIVRELASKVGMALPFGEKEGEEDTKKEVSTSLILFETVCFYHKSLTQEALDYLRNGRGLSDETIETFQLGFANGGLANHLLKVKGFNLDECVAAGVLTKKDGEARDYFWDRRIIIPNVRGGSVVHLSGRSLEQKEPKYFHLAGEVHHLFNEDTLRNEEVLVCEGQIDCLTAIQCGFNAAGVIGASGFKPEFLKKFSKVKKVTTFFDGDKAGRKGAHKVGALFLERCYIADLPEDTDVSELVKMGGRDALAALVSNAPSFFKWQLSKIDCSIDRTKLGPLLEPLLGELSKTDETYAEAFLAHEIKPRFGLSEVETKLYRKKIMELRKRAAIARDSGSSDDAVPEIVYSASFEGLVELVEQEGAPAFLIRDAAGIKVVSQFIQDNETLVPPPADKIPWLLPRAPEVLKYHALYDGQSEKGLNATLFRDLISYHESISELPTKGHYVLIAAWDIHTHLIEAAAYSPCVDFFGIPERGRSRTGKGMLAVSRRGIHVESLREAYLIRCANDLEATLFFDVLDLWKKAEKSGSEDILLHRFERGAAVPRVLFPEKGPHQDTVYYRVFGATIIGTNEPIHPALESRALPIMMPESEKKFETTPTPELGLELKERLTALRTFYFGKELPETAQPLSGRLGNILTPLLQVIRLVDAGKEEYFLDLCHEIEKRRKLEAGETTEAQITRAIDTLQDRLIRGTLPLNEIADKINDGKPDRYKFSNRRIGSFLSSLGFQKGHGDNGNVVILFDGELLSRLKARYGLSQRSERSGAPANGAKHPELSEHYLAGSAHSARGEKAHV